MALKIPYVCGPLTELDLSLQVCVKLFYTKIANACEEILGRRAFVPHEHYDPIRHADFSPCDVDKAERHQIYVNTSLLIVVPIAPSWGGGIEVEMAHRYGIPVLLLCERKKLKQGKISRLLRGNPAVQKIIEYDNEANAIFLLQTELSVMRHSFALAS